MMTTTAGNRLGRASSRSPHGWGNFFRTGLLLAGLTALVLAIGQRFGGPQGLLFAGVFVGVMNFGAWWFSDKIALAIHGALASLGVLIVAPIAATLLQLAVSRTREFGADETGAAISGNPNALARALLKLEQGNAVMPYDRAPATSHLFIVNPLSGGGVMKLFSTHPPIHERVARLSQM